tara:strand:+ start:411 stop:527 length:117 start_codon:yes stop_codon:yes gene_type:complete
MFDEKVFSSIKKRLILIVFFILSSIYFFIFQKNVYLNH